MCVHALNQRCVNFQIATIPAKPSQDDPMISCQNGGIAGSRPAERPERLHGLSVSDVSDWHKRKEKDRSAITKKINKTEFNIIM